MPRKITETDIVNLLKSYGLMIPSKTVILEKDSFTDIMQRYTNANVNLAEFYHENSKLSKYNIEGISAINIQDLNSLIRSIALLPRNIPLPKIPFENNWKSKARKEIASEIQVFHILRELTDEDCTFFFDCEFKIITSEGKFLTYDPSSKNLYIHKQNTLPFEKLHELLLIKDTAISDIKCIIVIIGVFIRNAVLFGTRGYRKTLIDTGRAAEYLMTKLNNTDLSVKIISEFFDREINMAAGCDGVEKAVLIVMTIRQNSDRKKVL
jgi:hypothetical protein